MPRNPKHDWDDKRDICYKLYIDEGLSISHIINYFAEHFKVPKSELPNRKNFHHRFKVWGFPSKERRIPKDKETAVLERTRELFKQNLPAAEIQQTLKDEGLEVDNYQFRKIRRKNGMLLRQRQGYKPGTALPRKRKNDDDSHQYEEEGHQYHDDAEDDDEDITPQEPAPLPPDEEARRAQRMVDLQLESDQLLQTRKRRRRIRGYGHMGPDDPRIPPRYGSETSLDECKAYLHLSNDLYVQIRAEFDAICREMGIIKMTLCADGQWQAGKDRLVRENVHLSAMLHPLQPDLDKRANALNCICTDVTKRMRTEGKRMSIADASNALGLDPLESKQVRRVLYDILEADHFTTVVACGKHHLQKLRDEWISKSEVLQNAIASGDEHKVKAVSVLQKDARKRYCDDQMKNNPEKRNFQRHNLYGPGPGPARSFSSKMSKPNSAPGPGSLVANTTSASADKGKTTATQKRWAPLLPPVGPAWIGREVGEFRTTTIADVTGQINFDLDPALSSHHTYGPVPWPPAASASTAETPSFAPATTGPPWPPTAAASTASSIPAYFRLAPNSQLVGHHPRMWLGKLAGANVLALHAAATSKAGAAKVSKVHGIAKNADGSEDSWLIENDDELGVYLEEAGEKATFIVALEGGYA